jgi:hypothetical protein
VSIFSEIAATAAANPTFGQPIGKYDPVPAGDYDLMIESVELKKYVAGVWKESEMAVSMAADPSIVPGDQVVVKYVIITDGPYNGKELEDKFFVVPASNEKPSAKMTIDQKLEQNRAKLWALFVRATKANGEKIKQEELASDNFMPFFGATVRLNLGVYVSPSNSKKYQNFNYTKDAGTPGATKPTSRPQMSDEAPF